MVDLQPHPLKQIQRASIYYFFKLGNIDIGEFAIGGVWAEMADTEVAAADEYLRAALGGFWVERLRCLAATRQGVAKLVEWRTAGDIGV